MKIVILQQLHNILKISHFVLKGNFMQYLLSKEEYESLIKENKINKEKDNQKLLDFCILASQYIPVLNEYDYSTSPHKCNIEAIKSKNKFVMVVLQRRFVPFH